jgi:mono/diheme cytochrome c family protein
MDNGMAQTAAYRRAGHGHPSATLDGDSLRSRRVGVNWRRRPAVWLAAALLALALLGSVLAWQRMRVPSRGRSFLSGDPVAGAMLFESKRCSYCHAINGSGGRLAPDLGARASNRSNLTQLVTTMWNHAPAMWKRMQQENLRASALSEREVSDLFAFLYLARYMDEPGNAQRGRRLFKDKGCIQCHAVRGEGGRVGPDLTQISGVDTPIQWAQTLWNHAPAMERHIQGAGVAWPRFDDAEMSDLLAYVRETSSAPRAESRLLPADPARGWELFKTKSCIVCHAVQGEGGHIGPDLGAGRQSPLTMVQFAGAMWNHSPQMYREMAARRIQRPVFGGQEMADLMAFFNSLRYFEPSGSLQAGKGLFAARGCSRCHGANAEGTSLGPALRGARPVNSVALATALWRHGPEMYRRTQTLGIAWPKLDENDLGDLFTFLNSSPAEESRR